MKKALVFLFLIFTGTFTFAEKLISADYYGCVENRFVMFPVSNTKEKKYSNQISPLGASFSYSYLMPQKNTFLYGFNVKLAGDFFNFSTISSDTKFSNLNYDFAYNLYAGIAAAIKYNFSDKHNLTFNPGLSFSRFSGKKGIIYQSPEYACLRIYGINFDSTLTYTYIFKFLEKHSLGFNTGINFSVPVYAYSKLAYQDQNKAFSFYENYNCSGSDAIRLFAGITFQIN